MKIDIAVIPETKKKLRGTTVLDEYIMSYSGVPQTKHASEGVTVFNKEELKGKIQSYEFVNERIVTLRIKSERGYLSIIGAYSTEEGRVEETKDFCDVLQTTLRQINQNDFIMIAGDLNACIGNNPIPDIMGQTINSNGKLLRDFGLYLLISKRTDHLDRHFHQHVSYVFKVSIRTELFTELTEWTDFYDILLGGDDPFPHILILLTDLPMSRIF